MKNITAVCLAAGESRRMGQPKLVLPWGDTTVIGQVVRTLAAVGLDELVVVSGGHRQELELEILRLREQYPVRSVHNPAYVDGDMLSSIQAGLSACSPKTSASLVVLGDQPQIEKEVACKVLEAYQQSGAWLVVPSYNMRRGHPWLISRELWPAVMGLQPPATLRDFMRANSDRIEYILVETDSILADLDTPEEYQRFRPKSSR